MPSKGADTMKYDELIDEITRSMIAHDAGSAKRIQHFIKVHRLAQLIGRAERIDLHAQFVLECAALVHDIGIGPCEVKYGHCTGALQEREGPAYARELLRGLGMADADIERVCYLVAHHHTYDCIEGIDYQILVEADFLVNLYEQRASLDAVEQALTRIFRTAAGSELCRRMFWPNNAQ